MKLRRFIALMITYAQLLGVVGKDFTAKASARFVQANHRTLQYKGGAILTALVWSLKGQRTLCIME